MKIDFSHALTYPFTLKIGYTMRYQLNNWWELRKMLKQHYSQLSDEDLDYKSGKEQELLLRLQQRTGESQENVERVITSFQVAYQQQLLL